MPLFPWFCLRLYAFGFVFLIFPRNTYSAILSGYVPLCRCFDCYEDLFATRACCTISPCGLYWSSCFLLLLCWWQFTRSFPEYFYSLRCSSDFNIRRVSILFYLSHFFTAFLESMRSRILLLSLPWEVAIEMYEGASVVGACSGTPLVYLKTCLGQFCLLIVFGLF